MTVFAKFIVLQFIECQKKIENVLLEMVFKPVFLSSKIIENKTIH